MSQKTKKKGFGKFIAGALVGGALGVLFAPKKGSETRKALSNKLKEFVEKVKEIDVEEVKDAFFEKVENIEKELKDLDKEKALKIAKKKAKDLKKLSEDLLEYAFDEGIALTVHGVAGSYAETWASSHGYTFVAI